MQTVSGFKCYGKLITPPQTSIHPRVSGGRTTHDKVNTAAKKSREVLKRKIANVEVHLVLHPRDGASAAHLTALKAA